MGLTALGIAASMLTSATTKDDEKSIYKALEKGEGDLRILYVTPEKVAKSKRFVSKLEKCNHGGRLSLIAIDVSGRDFTIRRPTFLKCSSDLIRMSSLDEINYNGTMFKLSQFCRKPIAVVSGDMTFDQTIKTWGF